MFIKRKLRTNKYSNRLLCCCYW